MVIILEDVIVGFDNIVDAIEKFIDERQLMMSVPILAYNHL